MISDANQEERVERRGRRHLDGSAPGKGIYLPVVAVTLRPCEIEELEKIGDGNRSAAVRRLLAFYRERAESQTAPV